MHVPNEGRRYPSRCQSPKRPGASDSVAIDSHHQKLQTATNTDKKHAHLSGMNYCHPLPSHILYVSHAMLQPFWTSHGTVYALWSSEAELLGWRRQTTSSAQSHICSSPCRCKIAYKSIKIVPWTREPLICLQICCVCTLQGILSNFQCHCQQIH